MHFCEILAYAAVKLTWFFCIFTDLFWFFLHSSWICPRFGQICEDPEHCTHGCLNWAAAAAAVSAMSAAAAGAAVGSRRPRWGWTRIGPRPRSWRLADGRPFWRAIDSPHHFEWENCRTSLFFIQQSKLSRFQKVRGMVYVQFDVETLVTLIFFQTEGNLLFQQLHTL